MEHLNVFNSLKNSKTIVGKLVSKQVHKQQVEIGDLVDVNDKIIYINTVEDILALAKEPEVHSLMLEVVNKKLTVIVNHNQMSNSFKKAIAEDKVKINSLVVVVVKNETLLGDENEFDLYINNDGYAVIKHYIARSYRKESKTPDVRFDEKEWVAVKRFQTGERWATSTDFDEDTIIAGYGTLNENGLFEYPLPNIYIKQIYNTTSWNELRRRSKSLSTV